MRVLSGKAHACLHAIALCANAVADACGDMAQDARREFLQTEGEKSMRNKHATRLPTLILVLAAAGMAHAADRFAYSNSGSEVIDSTTGLTWRRCAEGMTWDSNSCTGNATLFTHEGALAQAKIQSSPEKPWRLPNIKELASLVDNSRNNPAIDLVAFPNTPPTSTFWSSTPYAADSTYTWYVFFYYGQVSYNYRGNRYHIVRLVR